MITLDKSKCLDLAICRPNYLLRRPALKSQDLIQSSSHWCDIFYYLKVGVIRFFYRIFQAKGGSCNVTFEKLD